MDVTAFKREQEHMRALDRDRYTYANVIGAIIEMSGLTAQALFGSSRRDPLPIWRKRAYYLGYHGIGLSMAQIGWLSGDRDHTTIGYNLRSINEVLSGRDSAAHFESAILEQIEETARRIAWRDCYKAVRDCIADDTSDH